MSYFSFFGPSNSSLEFDSSGKERQKLIERKSKGVSRCFEVLGGFMTALTRFKRKQMNKTSEKQINKSTKPQDASPEDSIGEICSMLMEEITTLVETVLTKGEWRILQKTYQITRELIESCSGNAPELIQVYSRIVRKLADYKTEAQRELDQLRDQEANEYEPVLQKLENDVRQHIRVTSLNLESYSRTE